MDRQRQNISFELSRQKKVSDKHQTCYNDRPFIYVTFSLKTFIWLHYLASSCQSPFPSFIFFLFLFHVVYFGKMRVDGIQVLEGKTPHSLLHISPPPPRKRKKERMEKKQAGQAIYLFSNQRHGTSRRVKILRVSAKGGYCRLPSSLQLTAEFYPFI